MRLSYAIYTAQAIEAYLPQCSDKVMVYISQLVKTL